MVKTCLLDTCVQERHATNVETVLVKLNVTTKTVLVLSLVALAFSASYALGRTRTITVEGALKQEGVGSAAFSPDGRRVVFEMINAYDSAPRDAYRYTAWHLDRTLSKIYIADVENEHSARPLFPQHSDTGYWIGGFSPHGDELAFFSLEGGRVAAGVYNFKTDRVKTLGFPASYQYFGHKPPLWVSDEEAVFLAKSSEADMNIGLDRASGGPLRQADAWRRAWNNEAVTASSLGAGRYETVNSANVQKLVKVDVRTGEASVLGVQDYSDFELANSRRFLATLAKYKKSAGSLERRQELIVYDLQRHVEIRVCDDCDVAEELLSWSPDADTLLFFAHPTGEPKAKGALYRYDAVSNELGKVDAQPSFIADADKFGSTLQVLTQEVRAGWIGSAVAIRDTGSVSARHDWIAVSPNGAQTVLTAEFDTPPEVMLAASGDAAFFLADGDVWRVQVQGDTPAQNLTADYAPSLKPVTLGRSALLRARINHPAETALEAQVGDRTEIVFLQKNGGLAVPVNIDTRNVSELAASPRTGAVVYREDMQQGGSFVRLAKPGQNGKPVTLHDFNAHLEGFQSGSPVKFIHETADGNTVTSWLLLPPGAQEGDRHPMIVLPYAGAVIMGESWPPGSNVADTVSNVNFTVSSQLLAAAGYAVLLPSIPLQPAPSEPMMELVAPVMSAVDRAIELGYADPNRIGLMGHSYGGYTSLSLAAQSNRFKAAISVAGVVNLTSFYGQLAPPTRWAPRDLVPFWSFWLELSGGRMGSAPWQDPERYIRNSPLFHADKIATPIMLIHGDLDNVPIAQSEEMFTALARQNKDVLFIRYWGEYHTIASPANIRDMWRRIIDWYGEYLGDARESP